MAISSFSLSSVVVAPPPGWFGATKPFDFNRNAKKKGTKTRRIQQEDARDADSHPWKIASFFFKRERKHILQDFF